MKAFFQWRPLVPPAGHQSGVAVASAVGLATAAIAALFLVLGLDGGIWLYLPLILSVFLFGLPHGAIDHLVLIGLARRRLNLTSLAIACGLYLTLVFVFLILWWVSPLIGLILFLGITVYHWGKSDLAFESLNSPNLSAAPTLPRTSHLLLRGFLPIGTPFIAFPEATQSFITACTSSFGYDVKVSTGFNTVLWFVLLILLTSEISYLKRQRNWKRLLAEDCALLGYFILIPPVLAIGLYFCLWHGLRHVLRLIQYESDAVDAVKLSDGLKRFYIQALPFTLVSLLLVAAVVLLLPQAKQLDQLVGIYLVVISSLTLPHLCVVEWMDWRERI